MPDNVADLSKKAPYEGKRVVRPYLVPNVGFNTIQIPSTAEIVAGLLIVDETTQTGKLHVLSLEPLNGFAVDRKFFLAPLNAYIPDGYKFVTIISAPPDVYLLFVYESGTPALEHPDNENRIEVS